MRYLRKFWYTGPWKLTVAEITFQGHSRKVIKDHVGAGAHGTAHAIFLTTSLSFTVFEIWHEHALV